MEKNVKFSMLNDIYGSLLSDKQREILRMYHDDDLSLGEIADKLSISRQGVRDFIVRSEKALNGFESKLRICGAVERLERLADTELSEKARAEILEITELIKER